MIYYCQDVEFGKTVKFGYLESSQKDPKIGAGTYNIPPMNVYFRLLVLYFNYIRWI